MGSMMHDREAVTAYVPLVGLRVAEPPLDAQVVPLLDTLPAELSGLYASPARLVKDEEESQAILKSQSRCFLPRAGQAVRVRFLFVTSRCPAVVGLVACL